MELNITQFFNEACPVDYSASVAEIGENAGMYTWQAAKDDSQEYNMLDDEEKREAFRDFVRASGGWNDEEIAAWDNTELNALCIQWIAGDMRDGGLDADNPDWEAYQQASEQGQLAGSIFLADDGQVYWTCYA